MLTVFQFLELEAIYKIINFEICCYKQKLYYKLKRGIEELADIFHWPLFFPLYSFSPTNPT